MKLLLNGSVEESMREFTVSIVGIDFPNEDRAKSNRRSELLMLPPGVPMELRPEPRNRHDPQAIAVFSPAGVQVGYITAERAPWMGSRIRNGEDVRAIYQGLVGSSGYLRVRVGGGDPSLPPVAFAPEKPRDPQELAEAGDGFWPDDDGPEWGA
ncbi:HIRAN domain-containing protein [Sphingomonas phyllosphaerae]|uniref:HIRAN domain-containing protein n=1 Tax=Sphingomonas phyllosphaerae TaxID=257003 RepID=UPI00307C17C9